MDHPETGVNLTYISQDETTGDAGDQYTGLDRFGRVVEQNWYDPTTTSSVFDVQYGYDADGNVLFRLDNVNTAMSELYGYDNLGQLTSFERGTLNSGHTAITGTPSVNETWTYDPLGNRTTDTVGSTTTTETANLQNEITSVSGATTPTYDANGNMTTDQTGLKYVYDAWNRLVTVKNSGGTTLESYSYDGLGDRMTNTVGDTTTNFFYSSAGQVLEEQSGGLYTQRYVWSPNYFNEMIFRDTDTSETGLTATGTSYTRLWAVQDANYNVVALLNNSGTVEERYDYDPFGSVTVMSSTYTVEAGSSYNWVYLFQGGREDTITSDTQSGVRDDNSDTGTWTTPDPLGFGGGDDDLYGFEDNAAVGNVDPSGMVLGPPPGSTTWTPQQRQQSIAARQQFLANATRVAPQRDWFKDLSNFSAGWADGLTFNLTNTIRQSAGYNDAVDRSSAEYGNGQVVGKVHGAALSFGNPCAIAPLFGNTLAGYNWCRRPGMVLRP